jgi:hypothetical protein
MITFEEVAREEIGFGQLGFGSKRREMLSVRTDTYMFRRLSSVPLLERYSTSAEHGRNNRRSLSLQYSIWIAINSGP